MFAYKKTAFWLRLPHFILALTLLLTSITTLYVSHMAEARRHIFFNTSTQRVSDQIETHLQTYIALLQGVRGLFAASEYVTPDEFATYMRQMNLQTHYPGLRAMGFIKKSDLQRQQVQVDQTGPAIYIEPVDSEDQVSLSFDASTVSTYQEAMEQSLNQDAPYITPEMYFNNPKVKTETDNFFIFEPVYQGPVSPNTFAKRREHLLGYVFASFHADRMLQNILKRENDPQTLNYRIYDGDPQKQGTLLYSFITPNKHKEQPVFSTTKKLNLTGREWFIESFTSPSFHSGFRLWPSAFFAMGVFLSLVIFYFARLQYLSQIEAEKAHQDLLKSQKKLQSHQEELQTIIEAIPQIVWTATPDGCISYFNGKWLKTTGQDLQNSCGTDWINYVHPQDRQIFKDTWENSIQSGDEFSLEYRLRDVNGQYRWHLGRALPLKDSNNKIIKWFGTCTDIDDQKQMQQKVTRTNSELRRLNRMKSEFTSMVSHELRTPLSAIKEGIDLVFDEIEGPLNDDQKETLGIAKANVDRLARLITNVLDFSRIESGQMDLKIAFNHINDIAKESYNIMNLIARKKNIQFDLRLPRKNISLLCDSDKIKQVLINLIDNAIKFTPVNGHIHMTIAHVPRAVQITIEDTGIGIRREELDHIFEMYGQAKNRLNTRGAGVGLTVVKQIVEAHGGHINVISHVGKGSRFIITLPIRPHFKSVPRERKISEEPAPNVLH